MWKRVNLIPNFIGGLCILLPFPRHVVSPQGLVGVLPLCVLVSVWRCHIGILAGSVSGSLSFEFAIPW